MQTLREYSQLTENMQLLKALNDAGQISRYMTGRVKQRYEDAIALFKSGVEAGVIWNADYKDAYTYGINRGLEAAFSDKYYDALGARMGKGLDISDLYNVDATLAVTKIAKNHKILTKYKNDYPELFAIVDAVKGLPEVNAFLKSKIQKGKKPNQNVDPNKFVKPMATATAKQSARIVFQQAADKFRKRFIDDAVQSARAAYEEIKDAKNVKDIPKDPVAMQVASIIFIRAGGGTLRPMLGRGWDDVKTRVERAHEDTVNQFIEKNVEKTALIFAKKSGVKSHKLVRTSLRNGTVENTVHVVFDDNSEFMLDSQVIYKYSRSGKPFTQFPSKFKNVKLADGSKMTRPSEEKMIKEF